MSIAATRFDAPVTIESGVKSMTPLTVTPCPRTFDDRDGEPSLVVHCSSKPGLDIESTEMAASFLIHDVR
jgi:hypothetical protein